LRFFGLTPEKNNLMKKYTYTIAVALMSSTITTVLGSIAVYAFIVSPFKKEAVDRGFAAWVVTDNATGSTKFEWNTKILDELEKPLAFDEMFLDDSGS
jgi:hypothetical protein